MNESRREMPAESSTTDKPWPARVAWEEFQKEPVASRNRSYHKASICATRAPIRATRRLSN